MTVGSLVLRIGAFIFMDMLFQKTSRTGRWGKDGEPVGVAVLYDGGDLVNGLSHFQESSHLKSFVFASRRRVASQKTGAFSDAALRTCNLANYVVSENDERYQLDTTILFIIINNSTCFGHPYAHLQEYIDCILLHMLCSLVHCV